MHSRRVPVLSGAVSAPGIHSVCKQLRASARGSLAARLTGLARAAVFLESLNSLCMSTGNRSGGDTQSTLSNQLQVVHHLQAGTRQTKHQIELSLCVHVNGTKVRHVLVHINVYVSDFPFCTCNGCS